MALRLQRPQCACISPRRNRRIEWRARQPGLYTEASQTERSIDSAVDKNAMKVYLCHSSSDDARAMGGLCSANGYEVSIYTNLNNLHEDLSENEAVIVLDPRLMSENFLSVVRSLSGRPVLVLADIDDGFAAEEAMNAGAKAYVARNGPAFLFLKALRDLTEGKKSVGSPLYIDRFEVIELLGGGGAGMVYKARAYSNDGSDAETPPVAIKILRRDATIKDARARFETEGRALRGLDHPSIVKLREVGEDDGRCYLVVDYVDGRQLKRYISKPPIPVSRALHFAVQIAAGLKYAHDRDIVHRDIKPENVMVCPDDEIRILDFGLAIVRAPLHLDEPTMHVTAEGHVLGSWPYMSPEQIRPEGGVIDRRTDIFSLGTVLYELLCGTRPFADTSAILRSDPLPLSGNIPPEVHTIVSTCLAKNRDRRYQSSEDLQRALESALRNCGN